MTTTTTTGEKATVSGGAMPGGGSADAGKYGGLPPRRISQAIMNSLKGGVVPRVGLPYVTVGRKAEVEALLRDVGLVGEGGAAFRRGAPDLEPVMGA